jgi:malonate-semialdehyde dehydrogenase (acetylating) / methylmalonate-semialdehyde dehydrogenase
MDKILKNYINGKWIDSFCDKYTLVINPATTRKLAKVPVGCTQDVDLAAGSAEKSSFEWLKTPAKQRIQYLVKMEQILKNHTDEIAEICTNESGKTFAESKSEIGYAIDNIRHACIIPSVLSGTNTANNANEYINRMPVGVAACIVPFNFPILIPFWFFPYALACGNTYIVKPSEKVPMTMTRVFELFESLKLPSGVLNMVHGGKETVNAIINNTKINAISFVGSSAVAKYVYQHGLLNGKKVQAQGGAKNPIVVMPDADVDTTVKAVTDSAFGFAGQHCLAASLVILVGEAANIFTPKLIEAAKSKKCGYGMDPRAEVGPLITNESRKRIRQLIQEGVDEGAELLLDGRPVTVKGFEDGFFMEPTVISNIKHSGIVHVNEILGPVLGLIKVETLNEAIGLTNSSTFGSTASIFTHNETAARRFRHNVTNANNGEFFGNLNSIPSSPFGNIKESYYGDLSGQPINAIDFFTQPKIVMENPNKDE